MKYLLALLAGGLNVLCFSPFEWWYLLLPSFAILFFFWSRVKSGQAFWLGFFYGIGQFGAGVSWVYVSIQTFGGMPPALAAACVVGFVILLSLFPAFAGLLQSWFRGWGFLTRVSIIMPICFLLFEWLRGWVLTGLPWLSTGYALLPTPLAGYAPIGGVYLVGLIALATIGVVMAVVRDTNFRTVFASLLAGGAWFGSFALDQHTFGQDVGDPIKVALIQNNIPLLNKWNENRKVEIVTGYIEASARHGDKDLVVWPEGAMPEYIENLPPQFWRALEQHPADFAFGALSRPSADDGRYYNTLVAVSDVRSVYNKQHLVPFGEFFPFQELLDPVLQYLTIPMADFSAWSAPQAPVSLAGHRAAVSICYEDAFPHEWRSDVAESGFLLNVSEDMWFGNSLAPHQRLQMAQFRSRETERPMVRSSNNGLSSLISARGEIMKVAPQFQQAVVEGEVQPRTGVTPYVKFGDLPALIIAGFFLLFGLILGRGTSLR